MRFFIDKITRKFVKAANDSAPVTRVDYKRGDGGRIEVQFVSGGTVVELATGATGKFALKEAGKYDGEIIVGALTWAKEGTGTSTVYVFEPSFNVAALDTLLASGDDDDTNDLPSVTLMQEIEWVEDGLVSSSNTIDARVHNDVIKGTEGSPSELPTPDDEWVAHGHAQTLTAAKKRTARDNIEALGRLSNEDTGATYRFVDKDSDGLVLVLTGTTDIEFDDPAANVGTRIVVIRDSNDVTFSGAFGPFNMDWISLSSSTMLPDLFIVEAISTGANAGWFVTSLTYDTVSKRGPTASLPASPSQSGMFYYDTDEDLIYVSNNLGGQTPFATGAGNPIGWNATQSKFQKIVITGIAGSETTHVEDL